MGIEPLILVSHCQKVSLFIKYVKNQACHLQMNFSLFIVYLINKQTKYGSKMPPSSIQLRSISPQYD